MSQIKAVLYIGGNAPNREAEITVIQNYGGTFDAYYAPGFDICGDADCECRHRIIRGYGSTEAEALADYWEQWEERQS